VVVVVVKAGVNDFVLVGLIASVEQFVVTVTFHARNQVNKAVIVPLPHGYRQMPSQQYSSVE
jgi:hypothetical protein